MMRISFITAVSLLCLSSCGGSSSFVSNYSQPLEPMQPSSQVETSASSLQSEPQFDESLDPLSSLVKFLKANGKPGAQGYYWSYSKEYVETGSFSDSECTMTFFDGHYEDDNGVRRFIQPYIKFENTKLSNRAIRDDSLRLKPVSFNVQLRTGNTGNISKESVYLEFFSKATTTYHAYLDIIKNNSPYAGFWYTKRSSMTAELREFIKSSIAFFNSMQQIIFAQYGRHFLTETNFYEQYMPQFGDPLWFDKDKLVRYFAEDF